MLMGIETMLLLAALLISLAFWLRRVFEALSRLAGGSRQPVPVRVRVPVSPRRRR
jgi:flagellar biogenesis protein FliO